VTSISDEFFVGFLNLLYATMMYAQVLVVVARTLEYANSKTFGNFYAWL